MRMPADAVERALSRTVRRLWIGSMGLGRPLGSLYRLDGDGTVTPCFGGVIVSNTIVFAPDGRRCTSASRGST